MSMLKFQKGQKTPISKIELTVQDNWVCLAIWTKKQFANEMRLFHIHVDKDHDIYSESHQ